MTIGDTLCKFEERRFLELTREDAECLSAAIDEQVGEATGILAKTENTIEDAAFTTSHPWFVPYVIATEYVNKLPFSPEIAEYLRINPVIPGSEILSRDVAEVVPIESGASKETTDDVNDEVVLAGSSSDECADECARDRLNDPAPIKTCGDDVKKSTGTNQDSLKFEKIALCFTQIVEFVSRGTLPVPVYFESVVLPYLLKRDPMARTVVSSTDKSPRSMNATLISLASYDNGKLLSSVGFEMISTVIQSAGPKYGHKQIQAVIASAIQPTGFVELRDAYERCFPRYPATLYLITTNLKNGIMQLKKRG